MRNMLRRPALEWAAVIFQVVILFLGVITFHFNPNPSVLNAFSTVTGTNITGDFFSMLCVIGIIGSFSVLTKERNRDKVITYINSGLPVVAYLFPLGVYTFLTRGSIFTAWIYIAFFAAFILIALGIFRGVEREPDNSGAATNSKSPRA